MKIKVWGCRGSIPAPGKDTVRYGGNTTCIEVRLEDGTTIIVDAGSGIRKLGLRMVKEDLTEVYLYFTHAHWDHVSGVPFFVPAYSSRTKIYVRGGPVVQGFLRSYIGHQMNPPYFPVHFDAIQANFDFEQGNPTTHRIGTAEIVPIPMSHPNGGSGFKFIEGDKTFIFLPDNELDQVIADGLSKDEYVEICKGADVVMHDAQYTDAEYETRNGWGHSKLSSVVDLAVDAAVKCMCLFHHDPEHTDDDMDAIERECQEAIRLRNDSIKCLAAREGMEITLV